MPEIAVVITGASDGIGRAMAIEFASRGARVGLLARREDRLVELAAELRKLGSPDVRWSAVDVTNTPAFRSSLEAFENGFGGITHFVANAGVTGRSHATKDSADEIRECLKVNLLASIDGLEWMKERMVARRHGTLVGVSSVAATRGLPDSGAYSTSKAGLSTYLESLRLDLARYGVKVLTLAPGYIDTPLTKKNKGKMPFLMSASDAAKVFVDGILRGKKFIVAPYPYLWAIRLLRILPNCIYDRMMGGAVERIRGTPLDHRSLS